MAQRILGIDLGETRIGMAISDETQTVAQGMGVYRRRSVEEDLEHLKGIVEREDVERVVLGVPLNMHGSWGPQAEASEAFKGRLQEVLDVPVESFDERLTTQEAERVLLEADLGREKRKQVRDQQAAVLILQGYLDRRKRIAGTSQSA